MDLVLRSGWHEEEQHTPNQNSRPTCIFMIHDHYLLKGSNGKDSNWRAES